MHGGFDKPKRGIKMKDVRSNGVKEEREREE
jgi:hypothetical protein